MLFQILIKSILTKLLANIKNYGDNCVKIFERHQETSAFFEPKTKITKKEEWWKQISATSFISFSSS